MFRMTAGFLAALAFLGCSDSSLLRSGREDLVILCDKYWQFMMRNSPTWATYLGDRRFEEELPRLDPDSSEARREDLERILERLGAIDRERLDNADFVTAEVLVVQLERRLGEMKYRFNQWDIDQMGGPQVWLFELVNHHPMDDRGSMSFIERLRKFPRYMEEYLGNLRKGLEEGNVAPGVAVVRVIDQLKRILDTEVKNCPLMEGVEKLEPARRSSYRGLLEQTIRDDVYPAYRKMLKFLEEEYLAQARDEVALGWNRRGREAYDHRIWYHTSLRFDPEELHRIGLKVLSGLQERMLRIARKLGSRGNLIEFNERLRKDSSLFYETRVEVLADAQSNLLRARGTLGELFGRLPKIECVVKPIEDYREKDAPAAYYYGPSQDGSRPGTFYVNTYKPGSRAKYNMPALSLHEAVPGHHFQISLARERKDLPKFRRHTGVTAFVEGWALYAELLGEEVGLYPDDLAVYGMLTYQAWRAARLVVDTGIHALGWSRSRAIRFFRDNLAISEDEIINEIDRYIV